MFNKCWILFCCSLCQCHMQTLSNKTVEYVQCVLHVSTHTLNPHWIHPHSGIREILTFSIKPVLISTLELWNTQNWRLIWILGRIGLPNLNTNFVGSGSHILFWNTQFWDLILSGGFWSGLEVLNYWAQVISNLQLREVARLNANELA